MRWVEVDFERRCFHLADSKTGKCTVMLNTAALQVLAGIERFDDNPYVVVGARPGSHRSSLQNVWPRVCREAQLEDVRVNDLRHTHASVGVNAGLNLPVIGKLLGHTKITTTQRYAHLNDDPLRQVSEQQRIFSCAGPPMLGLWTPATRHSARCPKCGRVDAIDVLPAGVVEVPAIAGHVGAQLVPFGVDGRS